MVIMHQHQQVYQTILVSKLALSEWRHTKNSTGLFSSAKEIIVVPHLTISFFLSFVFNSVLWFVHAEGLGTAWYLSQDPAYSFCFDKVNVLACHAILKSISHLFTQCLHNAPRCLTAMFDVLHHPTDF